MVKQNKMKTNKNKHLNPKGRCTYYPPTTNKEARCNRGSRGWKAVPKPTATTPSAPPPTAAPTTTTALFDDTGKNFTNSAEASYPKKTRTPRVVSDSNLTQDLIKIVYTFIYKYRVGLFKISSTILCTAILTTAAAKRGFSYTPCLDVVVYCGVYSVWVITCLPWLLANLNTKTLGLIVGVITRLFAADIGILGWAAFRGDTQILHRGLRLQPVMEPSLSWLSSAGYSLRFGVLVSAVAASVIKLTLDSNQFSKLASSKRFTTSPSKQKSFSPPPSSRQRMTREANSLYMGQTCPTSNVAMETTAINKTSATHFYHLEDSIRHATSSVPRVDDNYSPKHSPDTLHSHRSKKDKYKKRGRLLVSPVRMRTDMSDNHSRLRRHQTQHDSKTKDKELNSPVKSENYGDADIADNSDNESKNSLALSDMCRKLLKNETIASPPCKFNGKKSPEREKKNQSKSKFTLKFKHAKDDAENKPEVKIKNMNKSLMKSKNKTVKPSMSPNKSSDEVITRFNNQLHFKPINATPTNKSTKQGELEERVKKMALFNEKVRQIKFNKRERFHKKRSQSEQPPGSRAAGSQSKPTNESSNDQNNLKESLSGKQKLGTGSYSKSMSRRKSIYKSTAGDTKKESDKT